jgi:hypothetical protein
VQGKSSSIIEWILTPIIRFCLHRSIKFQEFIEVSKHLYMRLAKEMLEKEGHEVNVSRLAITTGLQRREVTRLSVASNLINIKVEPSILHKIIGQWQGDKRFRRYGLPRSLTCKGNNSEFASLARSMSQDLNIYTVFFELERLNVIKREGDHISLVADAFNPGADETRGIELLAKDIGYLINAVEENLFFPNEIPNHHISTQYDNVTVEALPLIKKWFLEKGAELHQDARKILSKYDKDLQTSLKNKKGGARVILGSFSLCVEVED